MNRIVYALGSENERFSGRPTRFVQLGWLRLQLQDEPWRDLCVRGIGEVIRSTTDRS